MKPSTTSAKPTDITTTTTNNNSASAKKKMKKKMIHRHSTTPPDSGDAFIPDVVRSHARLSDDEAEAFAEELISSATSGEYMGEDARDEISDDELGGPFIEFSVTLEDSDPKESSSRRRPRH